MMNWLEYANHIFFVPSLLVGGVFVASLVVLGDKKNLKEILFWGILFSLCPYMIMSDWIYHALMHLVLSVVGQMPLLADVVIDYLSRIILIPVSVYVCHKRLSVHWSQSLFMMTSFVGIGYLGMVVGKTQTAAFFVDAVAIALWWKFIWPELMYIRESGAFIRFGFIGFVTAFSLFVNLAMYVCVRMIEATPVFLNYLVFVSSLFWLTLSVAVKLIFRTIRLTQEAEIARNHDELTGLPNALLFSNYVQELVSHDSKKRYAFVVFDIDNFKSFNERLGFEEGDAALKFMADVLKAMFGERYVTRVSCDTFRVLGEITGMNMKIKEVHDKIYVYPKQGSLEVNAGVYTQREPNENIERCFMRARLAETSIKGRYDEYIAIYVDEMSSRERLKMYLITHIDEAVEKEYIKVFYQPVVNAKTGKLSGFEALARWDDPIHGFISPMDFIGVLEGAHLIHKLDLFVLKKVCERYRRESDLGHTCVPFSFNLSRLDFKLSDIFKEVVRYTDKYKVPHNMLHIEITESVLDDDNDGLVKCQISRFQEEGFEVWMDDFGAGFSSLNMLKDYDFDFIKIDMIFLRNFSEKSKVVVQSMVEMAKRLKLGTLTEGVETREQLEFLREVGCDLVQGYYFSKPLPYGEVVKVLENKGITA
jgi:diguanylate cyclase (GGDEF)-like protein